MDKLMFLSLIILCFKYSEAVPAWTFCLCSCELQRNIFTENDLVFEEQAITEDNKKPDFLFPNAECYHNLHFPSDNLFVLGAKTTCKDRWRQVLTEANRVDRKYLFTLQQGISKNQLKEMHDSKLTLVVPRKYITSFPKEYQDEISDLSNFIRMVGEKQKSFPKFYLF